MKNDYLLIVLPTLLVLLASGCEKIPRVCSMSGTWSNDRGEISIGRDLLVRSLKYDGNNYRLEDPGKFTRSESRGDGFYPGYDESTSYFSVYVAADPMLLYLQKYEVKIYFKPSDPGKLIMTVRNLVPAGGQTIYKFPSRLVEFCKP